MSQFWHSHWAEDAYKPGLLGNWQVPNWHPKWPCVRHCVTTTFLADKSGRLLPDKPKPKRSPWGDFKGTWELPLKIDRKLAHKLSAPPKHKLAAWEAHKRHYEGPCGIKTASPKTKEKPTAQAKRRKSPVKSPDRTKKLPTKTRRIIDRNKEKTAKTKSKETKKTIDNAKRKKAKGRHSQSKDREAKETMVKTRRSTASRGIDKTKGQPKVDRLEAQSVTDKSEASEDEDQSTVNEEQEFAEEESIIEEESTDSEEPEYNDDRFASEEATAEKRDQKDREKEKRTECLCETSVDSKSLGKVVTKEPRNICTVHRRLRV